MVQQWERDGNELWKFLEPVDSLHPIQVFSLLFSFPPLSINIRVALDCLISYKLYKDE